MPASWRYYYYSFYIQERLCQPISKFNNSFNPSKNKHCPSEENYLISQSKSVTCKQTLKVLENVGRNAVIVCANSLILSNTYSQKDLIIYKWAPACSLRETLMKTKCFQFIHSFS